MKLIVKSIVCCFIFLLTAHTYAAGVKSHSAIANDIFALTDKLTFEEVRDKAKQAHANNQIYDSELKELLNKINIKEQANIESKRAVAAQKKIAIAQKIKLRAEKDKRLPLNVRKDKYMVALTNNLKQEKYYKAIAYFDLLNDLDVELSPSFTYFWGEALLKIKKPEESLKKLYTYIEKVGSSGKYYSQALQLINQAEDL